MRDIAIGAKETLIGKTVFPNLVTTLAPLELCRYQAIQLILVLGTQLLTKAEVMHNVCNINLRINKRLKIQCSPVVVFS